MVSKILSIIVVTATAVLYPEAKRLRIQDALQTEMLHQTYSKDSPSNELVDTCGNVLPTPTDDQSLMKPKSGDIDIWAMTYFGEDAQRSANTLCSNLNSGCSCGACRVLLGAQDEATAIWHEDSHKDAAGVERLIEQNKMWRQVQLWWHGEDYFLEMAKGQSPKYLYIGCIDSRVPPEQITGSGAGDIFVTRNVANQILPGDESMISAVNFAVTVMEVSHVLVTGHYRCGGVEAALTMTDKELGKMSPWISTLKEIAEENKQILDKISDKDLKVDCLAELSVYKQMDNLKNYDFIQEWTKTNPLNVHPMMYDISTGSFMELPAKGLSPACEKGTTMVSSA